MKEINLREEYTLYSTTQSDINEHLPTLWQYAKKCSHITEMGVRSGASTRAFLYADPKKFIAYDLLLDPKVNSLFEYCKSIGKDYHYYQKDVLEIEIEETDFLFIDTYHCYEQLTEELKLHSNKVSKYIAFHDTVSYARIGENLPHLRFEGLKGIMYAIEEFLENNKEWKIVHNAKYNNGLMIIEKQ